MVLGRYTSPTIFLKGFHLEGKTQKSLEGQGDLKIKGKTRK